MEESKSTEIPSFFTQFKPARPKYQLTSRKKDNGCEGHVYKTHVQISGEDNLLGYVMVSGYFILYSHFIKLSALSLINLWLHNPYVGGNIVR